RCSSASETSTSMSRLRLRLAVLEVKIWRACEWPRLNFPVAVVRKRFAAPLCVLSFGIVYFLPVLIFSQSVVFSEEQNTIFWERRSRTYTYLPSLGGTPG